MKQYTHVQSSHSQVAPLSKKLSRYLSPTRLATPSLAISMSLILFTPHAEVPALDSDHELINLVIVASILCKPSCRCAWHNQSFFILPIHRHFSCVPTCCRRSLEAHSTQRNAFDRSITNARNILYCSFWSSMASSTHVTSVMVVHHRLTFFSKVLSTMWSLINWS